MLLLKQIYVVVPNRGKKGKCYLRMPNCCLGASSSAIFFNSCSTLCNSSLLRKAMLLMVSCCAQILLQRLDSPLEFGNLLAEVCLLVTLYLLCHTQLFLVNIYMSMYLDDVWRCISHSDKEQLSTSAQEHQSGKSKVTMVISAQCNLISNRRLNLIVIIS